MTFQHTCFSAFTEKGLPKLIVITAMILGTASLPFEGKEEAAYVGFGFPQAYVNDILNKRRIMNQNWKQAT